MGRLKLLLVEDNPGDARLLRETLSEAGADLEVEHVETMRDAAQRLTQETFGAVLLDLSLPDSRGLATVAAALAAAPTVAIVVLTGVDDEATALEAVRGGAQDYLVKGHTQGRMIVRAVYYALERKKSQLERERLIHDLQEALATVKRLSGLLPICSSCKRVRDDQGYWTQIEEYIHEHSEADFSHGICPECMKKLYPEYCQEHDGPPAAGEEPKSEPAAQASVSRKGK
jgi:DNA-binding NtrC family response regulator